MKKFLLIPLLLLAGQIVFGQIITFNDANFKQALVNNSAINTNGDTEIQVSEAINFTGTIGVANSGINNLTGIEFFTEIVGLQVQNNGLLSVDLSQNTKLRQLLMEGNSNLQGDLDLSMMSDLTDFKGHSTRLTSVNIANGNNRNITRFEVGNSFVTCVQVDPSFNAYTAQGWSENAQTNYQTSPCSGPSTVLIPDNAMKDFLVQNSTININGDNEIQLTEAQAQNGFLGLNARSGPLGGFDRISDPTGIEAFVNITELQSRNNLFTSIDLSQNTALTVLDLEQTPISQINLMSIMGLQELNLKNCNLTELDISSLTNLNKIEVQGNGLNRLYLPNAPNLTWLDLSDNELNANTSIDLSRYPLLQRFYIGQFTGTSADQIAILDFSQNPNLNFVYVNNMVDLIELNIANGNNSNIINSNFRATNLPNLNCIEVNDVTYAQNNWTNIDQGLSFSTDCSTLSIDDFTNDPSVSIYPIPTDDWITIKSDVKVENVKVYNTVGLKVTEFETNEFAIGTLANGVYFLKITLENGKEGVQRIVKN